MNLMQIDNFPFGIIDSLEADSIPKGATPNALNWLHKGDKIELLRGFAIFGDENTTDTDKITGIISTTQPDGTQITFRTRGKKLEYRTSGNWIEIGTNVLGNNANGKEISMGVYQSLAGKQLWVNSPYGPLLKIMIANPGSYADMYDATKNFYGYIKFLQNRMILWGRLADKTGYYGSNIDEQNFTTVSGEAVGGSGATRSGTLAFKAGGAKRTCFGVSITDGVETFTDSQGTGVLTGSAGGTGTINYMTGAYSVTFNASPGAPVTASYQWEDSTNGGVADFTYTSPTRVAGEGFYLPQDDGGELMDVYSIGAAEYCLHKTKVWRVTLTVDDTKAQNEIYRERVGIPKRGGAVAGGDGIYYLDYSDEKDPQVRLLTFEYAGTEIIPISISKRFKFKDQNAGVNLEDYRFDQVWLNKWGDYILVHCRHKDRTYNNRTLIIDVVNRTLNWSDYYANCSTEADGTYVVGDPISSNCYTIFSGWDADGSIIYNYWDTNWDNLGYEGGKKERFVVIEGEIQINQTIELWMASDYGSLVKIGEVAGNGSYVDRGQAVHIGAPTLGSKELGGGEGSTAYHYKKQMRVSLSKFTDRKIEIKAIGIGYASVSFIEDRDWRKKSRKISAKYRE